MHWGYALVWPRAFLTRDADPLMAKLKFLAHYGLETTGIGLREVAAMSEAQRDDVGNFLAQHNLSLSVHLGLPYFDADRDLVRRHVDEALEQLSTSHSLLRTMLVTTGAGDIHRFHKQPPLPQQLEQLAEALMPVVAGCQGLGLPVGIENHGDYYCSDLVDLCQMVPGLGIFLDTGNTYLIGEAPLPAIRAAAPYVVGTHFKDHHVRPRLDARPLHFEVAESVTGDGDVPLRECYQILLDTVPDPAALVMEIELIPPPNLDVVEAFERSLTFVRSLPQVKR